MKGNIMKKITRRLPSLVITLALLVGGIITLTPDVVSAVDPAKLIQPAVPPSDKSLEQYIADITNMLLFIIGAISVIVVIVGGLKYVTSDGDPGKIKGAKDTILYAVVGIVIAVLAYAIVNFVLGRFTT